MSEYRAWLDAYLDEYRVGPAEQPLTPEQRALFDDLLTDLLVDEAHTRSDPSVDHLEVEFRMLRMAVGATLMLASALDKVQRAHRSACDHACRANRATLALMDQMILQGAADPADGRR